MAASAMAGAYVRGVTRNQHGNSAPDSHCEPVGHGNARVTPAGDDRDLIDVLSVSDEEANGPLRMRPTPTQPNRALLLTNADDFGSGRCATAFYFERSQQNAISLCRNEEHVSARQFTEADAAWVCDYVKGIREALMPRLEAHAARAD